MKRLSMHMLLITSITCSAFAQADTVPNQMNIDGLVQLSQTHPSRSSQWTGIGRVRGPNASICTASLIDTRQQNSDIKTTPAYIMTSQRCFNSNQNGHYRYSGGTEVNINTSGSVYFNHFNNTLGQTKNYTLKTVVWQSDNRSSISIIELNEPLSTLLEADIHPLKIASHTPPTGTDITALGIPHASNLYATYCKQLDPVDTLSHPWVSTHMLPNRCASLSTGGYGGPVLNNANNELISLIVASTHTADSNNTCQAFTPCEITGRSTHWNADTHYTLAVSFLNPCFPKGVFNLNASDCSLSKQNVPPLKDPLRIPARILEHKTTAGSTRSPEFFTVALREAPPYIRYKYTHDAQACNSGKDYSPRLTPEDNEIKFTLDETTGLHLLCIVGLNNPDATPDEITFRSILAIERLKATAALPPLVELYPTHYNPALTPLLDNNHSASWTHASPFHEHYEYKHGPYHTVDCMSPEGYQPVIDMSNWLDTLFTQGTIDPNLYTGLDFASPATKRIMGKLDKEQTIKYIPHHDHTIKLCTVSYNRENVASAPSTYIFEQH